MGYLDRLAALLRQHHDMYLRVYPRCAIPKLHWLLHFVSCASRVGHNINCFAVGWSNRGVNFESPE